jgi:hypothetical protein
MTKKVQRRVCVAEKPKARPCPVCRAEKPSVIRSRTYYGCGDDARMVLCVNCGWVGPLANTKCTAIRQWNKVARMTNEKLEAEP